MQSESRQGGPRQASVIRFLATGGLNTLFGYLVYASLLALGLGLHAALLLATVAGVVFNFFSYGRLVFRGDSGHRAFLRFVVAYAAIYAANAGLLQLVTSAGGIDPYLGQVLCLPATVLLGWILMKRWVFAAKMDL